MIAIEHTTAVGSCTRTRAPLARTRAVLAWCWVAHYLAVGSLADQRQYLKVIDRYSFIQVARLQGMREVTVLVLDDLDLVAANVLCAMLGSHWGILAAVFERSTSKQIIELELETVARGRWWHHLSRWLDRSERHCCRCSHDMSSAANTSEELLMLLREAGHFRIEHRDLKRLSNHRTSLMMLLLMLLLVVVVVVALVVSGMVLGGLMLLLRLADRNRDRRRGRHISRKQSTRSKREANKPSGSLQGTHARATVVRREANRTNAMWHTRCDSEQGSNEMMMIVARELLQRELLVLGV